MSKYFFDIHGLFPNVDEEGREVPSDEAAWRETQSLAARIFGDAEGKMRRGEEWSIDVKDQKGQPVFLIHVSTKKLNRRSSSGSAA